MTAPQNPSLSGQLNLAALRGQPDVAAAAVTGWLDAGAPELDAPLSPEQAQAAARCRELLALTQTALAELTPQALAARPGVTLSELCDGPGWRAQIALGMNRFPKGPPAPVEAAFWPGLAQAWGAARMIHALIAATRHLAAGQLGEGLPGSPHWRAGPGEISRAETRMLEPWVKLLPSAAWQAELGLDAGGMLALLTNPNGVPRWLTGQSPLTPEQHWQRQVAQRYFPTQRSQLTPDWMLALAGRPRPGETPVPLSGDEWSDLQALIRAQPPTPLPVQTNDVAEVSALMALRLPPCHEQAGHPRRALLLAVAARQIVPQGLNFVAHWPLHPHNDWKAAQLADARALMALLTRLHDAGHLRRESELSRLSVTLSRHLRSA